MTDAEIDAMEPGPEMDRAVAEACGLVLDKRSSGALVRGLQRSRTILRKIEDGTRGLHFRPSLEWDCAMFAAELFGLFDSRVAGRMSQTLGHDGKQWSVQECYEPPLEYIGTKAPTGTLALCRAILKLSRQKQPA